MRGAVGWRAGGEERWRAVVVHNVKGEECVCGARRGEGGEGWAWVGARGGEEGWRGGVGGALSTALISRRPVQK